MPSNAEKYRGATVEDLEPPTALSLSPNASISHALLTSYSHDYTHLTITAPSTRALLGYIGIPRLQQLLKSGEVKEEDTVEKAMLRFKRRGRPYKVITLDTPLEELEEFFEGVTQNAEVGKDALANGVAKPKQDFAVVTDAERKFVIGVVTKGDLEEFVRRRPT